jgi:hypothetical protein
LKNREISGNKYQLRIINSNKTKPKMTDKQISKSSEKGRYKPIVKTKHPRM